jgi:hypothetical protein
VDAWGFADGTARVAAVMPAEQVAAEERDENVVDESWQAAISPRAKNQGKVGFVSASLEIGIGPELGLRVGLGDEPALARGNAVAPEVGVVGI